MKTRVFLSCMVLLALALVGPRLDAEEENAAAQSEPAHIVVRADEALAPVSPLLFGQNYGPWMDTTDVYVDFYRGRGLWVGIVLKDEAGGARRFCEALMERGLLCKETHENVIRLAPPLIITKEEIDWALGHIRDVLTIP